MGHYKAFIDDSAHCCELEGQRFVVLRVSHPVSETYARVQAKLRERLFGLPVSYPASAHVTLAAFAPGTPLHTVQDVTTLWAHSVPPLLIEPERLDTFPAAQIVMMQVRKARGLVEALTGLWRLSKASGLTLSTPVSADQWNFHMSLAYCSGLNASSWQELTRSIESVEIPWMHCLVREAEIVAFDGGREYSGGAFSLDGARGWFLTSGRRAH